MYARVTYETKYLFKVTPLVKYNSLVDLQLFRSVWNTNLRQIDSPLSMTFSNTEKLI